MINGGRVMDPETGLDAVRNVGVTDGKIAAVQDNSTMQDGGLPSTGIPTVLVNGTVVVRDSENVNDVFPGKPIIGSATLVK